MLSRFDRDRGAFGALVDEAGISAGLLRSTVLYFAFEHIVIGTIHLSTYRIRSFRCYLQMLLLFADLINLTFGLTCQFFSIN